MPAKKGLTLDTVIAALRKANGNISLTARQLGVERNAVQHYLRNYPTAREAADEAAAYITDIAEGHLVSRVMRGDWDQVRYWLENKAKDRGYGRSTSSVEVSGPQGAPIPIAVDRSTALAAIAPRPMGNSDASGDGEGDHDG